MATSNGYLVANPFPRRADLPEIPALSYIKAPVWGMPAVPFLLVSVPLGDFFMTLLFFVSGVASFFSFQKRGSGIYVGERTKKLMLTFLLGFFLLCPVTAYQMALYDGFEGGFISFIPQFFWYKSFYYLGYGHLWFLLYLYVFSMLCIPLFNRWQRDENHIRRIGDFLLKGHRLLLPVGVVILLELLLRPSFHTGAYIIIFDWANDAIYLSVFIYGYIFAADSRIQKKVKEYFKTSIVFGILSLAALFYVNIQSQVLYSDEVYLTLLWALAKGVYECSAIIFLLNAGIIFLNKDSRTIQYLNRASFTVYIFHYLPVTFFTLLFSNLKIQIFIKFLLVVGLSYLTVFLIYEFWRRVSSFKQGIVLKR